MGSFHSTEFGYGFESGDGVDVELNQHNFWVWINRSEPFMDMVQVTDPRDDRPWTWFREKVGDETFDEIETMARTVGSIILRATPTEEMQDVWHSRYAAPDDLGDLYASE